MYPVPRHLTPGQDFLGLAVLLLVSLAVSAAGGAITATSVDGWYQTLEKPWFNPPAWVFAPVWTALYVLMAVAGWRIWRSAAAGVRWQALIVYAVQLGANVVWSLLFFGLQRIGLAMIEILALWLLIVATTVLFGRIDRLAGILFVPYVLWVTYAAALNGALWVLN